MNFTFQRNVITPATNTAPQGVIDEFHVLAVERRCLLHYEPYVFPTELIIRRHLHSSAADVLIG